MIVLDLYAEISPLWKRMSSFYGQPFIWCMLHNFGGNIGMHGALRTIASEPVLALQGNNTMIGTGIAPEGIKTNYVLYDLMLEMGWRTKQVELDGWIDSYIERRYGGTNDDVSTAWRVLTATVYNDLKGDGRHVRAIPCIKPALNLQVHTWYNREDVLEAWDSMVKAAPQLIDSPTFRYDLVDVTRQALQVISWPLYNGLMTAYKNRSFQDVNAAANRLVGLIQDMDDVLLTNNYFLLGCWLQASKRLASSSAEQQLLEFNARNQITMWGPHENIEDYANKMWSGLLGSYYKQRWLMFLDFLLISIYQKAPFDQTQYDAMTYEFEENWNRARDVYPEVAQGDTYHVVGRIYEKYINELSYTVK